MDILRFSAPQPSTTEQILATKCIDTSNGTEEWFYVRGPKPCRKLDFYESPNEDQDIANDIVFAFQVTNRQSLIDLLTISSSLRSIGNIRIDSPAQIRSRPSYRDGKNRYPSIFQAKANILIQRFTSKLRLLPSFEMPSNSIPSNSFHEIEIAASKKVENT